MLPYLYQNCSMRYSLLILLTATVCCRAQVIEIRPSNPAPRVGDDIEIAFDLRENDPDSLQVANDPLAKMLLGDMNSVGTVNIQISGGHVTEPGPLRIGPLQIPVDSKIYKTDVLEMTVSAKLPSDIINGIWIRVGRFAGTDYIIYEQRQPGSFKEVTNERGGISHSISTEGAEWSDIHIDKIERLGIEIKRTRTFTSVDFVDAGDALYKLVVYTYKPLPSFKGELTLDKTFIWKPPANCHIEIARF
jgi:hypothetical protein